MYKIEEIIRQRILILDGAMGTMIQSYGQEEADYRGIRFARLPGVMKGNNDLLNLTRPDIIADIHKRYLEAGADIIETNTFSSQRISMADYHVEEYAAEMAAAGCRIARRVADEFTRANPDRPRFVAGSVGPTNKSCSISPDVSDPALRSITFDQLVEAYEEQMTAMLEAGVDTLLIETVFDTLNAKAAIYAAEQAMSRTRHHVPLMLSMTIADTAGRTLSGQTPEAFLASIQHAPLFSVGINCSFGAEQLIPFIRIFAQKAPYYISIYPNAGLPNSLGQYEQTPEQMASQVKTCIDEQLVNIIGGCCGTTEQFIARFPALVEGQPPHVPVPPPANLWLSGLELLELTPERRFINIGERCNVSGSRKFLRLINEKKYDEALSIARKQVEDGALVLDVNMDDALLDTQAEMVNFLNLMMSDPDIARVPVMIDSSDWNVIRAALKCVQGKSIVNSISLKEGEDIFLSHAREVRRFGASVVVMAFDEQGQATTYERKIAICQRAYTLLVNEAGFNPCDIIFDPNVLSVATGIEEHNDYALDFIRATRWIRRHLPGTHVSGGISNLSFSFRGNNYIREAMHAVFLYHTIQAGEDFGIVNPSAQVTYSDLPQPLLTAIDDVLLNRRPDATEHLISMAAALKNETADSGHAAAQGATWRDGSLPERLAFALVHGNADYLEPDLNEALQTWPNPVDIIQGPLMDAMQTVGERFGRGQMFLPQVVKTARTMKKAVAILQPHIEAHTHQSGSLSPGRILMATVKGDVHDIGKNIVGVILACNNYEVIDLGVMVPAETIVQEAVARQADIVALSGLITPSLDEMVHVAQLLQQQGLHIPLMIGGATTSELHTALRIAPAYDAPVIWLKDASQNVPAAHAILNPKTRDDYARQLSLRYARLREEYRQQTRRTISLGEAREHKPLYHDE